MNEQLRKAIEEATKMCAWREDGVGARVVSESACNASQAKLLRVIELLVQQRDEWIEHIDLLTNKHRQHDRIKSQDAELIAALKET